ncbi:MAG: hypothetical protein ACE5HP_12890, partial [Gemmatimonadota bacterium]
MSGARRWRLPGAGGWAALALCLAALGSPQRATLEAVPGRPAGSGGESLCEAPAAEAAVEVEPA